MGGGNLEVAETQQSPQPGKRTITGTVLDTQGEPLPGASIYVKGDTKNGVTADAEGRFTLSVPQKTKAVIVSFVGMNPQEVVLLDKTENYVVRLESSTTIDEVVVTGIVTKRKDTFTGSSASFSGEELKAVGVQNPLASLRSLDPSFNLMESDIFGSDPNRLPDIEIRGKSSIMGMRDEVSEDPNQPLFILDGFESTLETIYNLDINRIASMTILKDAASTAIYGSKAANGVVVVETVKPQPGQLRLSYNGSMDISWPDLTSYNLMNAREKLEFERLAGKYGDGNDVEREKLYNQHLADVVSGVDTYWLSEPVRTGINHRHQLYVDGGAGGFMFGIGLNYKDHAGDLGEKTPQVFPGSFYKPASCIAGPGDEIKIPALPEAQKTTAEGELGVIIGKKCKFIEEKDWLKYVAGYTTILDMTEESILRLNPRYLTIVKGFDTFFTFGPQLVTPDEIPDVSALEVATVHNGEVHAKNTVSNMTFSPSRLVALVSHMQGWLPGDILSTGTPRAVHIQDGDVAECRITGPDGFAFEPLVNPVIDLKIRNK